MDPNCPSQRRRINGTRCRASQSIASIVMLPEPSITRSVGGISKEALKRRHSRRSLGNVCSHRARADCLCRRVAKDRDRSESAAAAHARERGDVPFGPIPLAGSGIARPTRCVGLLLVLDGYPELRQLLPSCLPFAAHPVGDLDATVVFLNNIS